VARNRARRIVREAWREAVPEPPEELDIVLVARPPIVGATTRDLVNEMRELIRRTGIDAG
jgi:ribonuclease P protein component